MTQPVSYIIFDVQLVDAFSGKAISDVGGNFFVCNNGLATLATIYDPDNNFAAVGNPKGLINGKLRFAIQQAAGGQAFPPLVDIYGMTAAGRFFIKRSQSPGDVPNYAIDGNKRDQCLYLPYSFAAAGGANIEKDFGITMPAGALMQPQVAVMVVDTDSHTISYGTLSSQSGGSANGFATVVSTNVAGTIKATINGAGATLGALLSVASGAGSTLVPEWYPLPALDVKLSYKFAASTAAGSGFIIHPYQLPQ